MSPKELVEKTQEVLVAFRELAEEAGKTDFGVSPSDERLSFLRNQLTIADCKICVVMDQICSLGSLEIRNNGKVRAL